MRNWDIIHLSVKAITAHRLRTSLILTAMAIGVAAVILLSTLGDSARRYVTGEFASLGTNLLIVLPGRSETTGGPPPLLGETPRDLTLDDASALLRGRHIRRIAPVTIGSAPVSWGGLEREVTILGSTTDLINIRHLKMSQGRFLPRIDLERAVPVCVLGNKIRDELFGNRRALGEWIRIADRRFRVIGMLEPEGESITVDFDDTVIVTVASALALFDSPSLFRILAEAKTPKVMAAGAEEIREIIKSRHEGEDDVTVITQDAVVRTFDRILNALTLTVTGIASISLAVAAILIMNVMLVSVSQRTEEIGVLKAIGAASLQIRWLFICEAVLLSLFGALLGVALGLAAAGLLRELYPILPLAPPAWSIGAAFTVALGAGLLFGVLPANRAAKLDPVQALSRH